MKRPSGKRSTISVWTRVDPEFSPSRSSIVQSSILGIVNILPLALHSSIRAFIAAITLSMPFSFHPCIQALFCHLRPGPLAYSQAVRISWSTGSYLITPVNCHSSFRFPLQQFYHEPTSLYKPTSQSPSLHQSRYTIQTHSSPPPEPTGNSFVPTALTPPPANTALSSKWCWCESCD